MIVMSGRGRHSLTPALQGGSSTDDKDKDKDKNKELGGGMVMSGGGPPSPLAVQGGGSTEDKDKWLNIRR